jgi:hypothetical protein
MQIPTFPIFLSLGTRITHIFCLAKAKILNLHLLLENFDLHEHLKNPWPPNKDCWDAASRTLIDVSQLSSSCKIKSCLQILSFRNDFYFGYLTFKISRFNIKLSMFYWLIILINVLYLCFYSIFLTLASVTWEFWFTRTFKKSLTTR